MKLLAWFQLATGTAMVVLWTALLATSQVPELAAGQRDIVFHLVAESVTAALLLSAGWTILRGPSGRGRALSAFALGALLYTAVNSAGYYAELGDWGPVGMFAALAAGSVALFARQCLRGAVGDARVDR